jgi:polyhydroxybutyrate depolymerase
MREFLIGFIISVVATTAFMVSSSQAANTIKDKFQIKQSNTTMKLAQLNNTWQNYGASSKTVEKTLNGRIAKIYEPFNLTKTNVAPTIIMLHGGYGNATTMEKSMQFHAVADQYGFRIVYLNGTGLGGLKDDQKFWNAGDCCGVAKQKNIDDIAYIDGVINELVKSNFADPQKIYIVGHSNGAMMSYRYACERSNKITAIIPMSGTPAIDVCFAQGIKISHIHGLNDKAIPVEGGTGTDSLYKNSKSVKQTEDMMVKSGAIMSTTLLKNTEHNIDSLKKGMLSNYNTELSSNIAAYLNGKTK